MNTFHCVKHLNLIEIILPKLKTERLRLHQPCVLAGHIKSGQRPHSAPEPHVGHPCCGGKFSFSQSDFRETFIGQIKPNVRQLNDGASRLSKHGVKNIHQSFSFRKVWEVHHFPSQNGSWEYKFLWDSWKGFCLNVDPLEAQTLLLHVLWYKPRQINYNLVSKWKENYSISHLNSVACFSIPPS